MAAKKALGRGLDALISEEGEGQQEEASEGRAEGVRLIPVSRIAPNPNQPRKTFEEQGLDELSRSIKEHGMIQPVVVRSSGDSFELIVGERRYRAAKQAGLEEIPAVVKESTEELALELALIENIQREDLNPIEEAGAYRMILEKELITQAELSKRVSKSRSYIANMIRLLDLPDDLQEHVSRGTISVGQAKAVAVLPREKQKELVKRILEEGLTVRDVERLVKEGREDVPRGTLDPASGDGPDETTGTAKEVTYRDKDPFIDDIEDQLRERFGTKAVVEYRKGKGVIRIEFYSNQDLERILGIMQE
jgi:ParB family chromosome partitioning protein